MKTEKKNLRRLFAVVPAGVDLGQALPERALVLGSSPYDLELIGKAPMSVGERVEWLTRLPGWRKGQSFPWQIAEVRKVWLGRSVVVIRARPDLEEILVGRLGPDADEIAALAGALVRIHTAPGTEAFAKYATAVAKMAEANAGKATYQDPEAVTYNVAAREELEYEDKVRTVHPFGLETRWDDVSVDGSGAELLALAARHLMILNDPTADWNGAAYLGLTLPFRAAYGQIHEDDLKLDEDSLEARALARAEVDDVSPFGETLSWRSTPEEILEKALLMGERAIDAMVTEYTQPAEPLAAIGRQAA